MMTLQGNPGWGNPTGVHGEIRISQDLTDLQIISLIKERVRKEKLSMGDGVVQFEKQGIDGDQQVVVFEVN